MRVEFVLQNRDSRHRFRSASDNDADTRCDGCRDFVDVVLRNVAPSSLPPRAAAIGSPGLDAGGRASGQAAPMSAARARRPCGGCEPPINGVHARGGVRAALSGGRRRPIADAAEPFPSPPSVRRVSGGRCAVVAPTERTAQLPLRERSTQREIRGGVNGAPS